MVHILRMAKARCLQLLFLAFSVFQSTALLAQGPVAGYDYLTSCGTHHYYISQNVFFGNQIAGVVNDFRSKVALPANQVYAAAIVNATENACITNAMLSYNSNKYGGNGKSTFENWGDPRNPWIGLSDAGSEGTFNWLNGQPNCEDYRNWNVGEPNNYTGPVSNGEDFTQMLIMNPYLYNGNLHDPLGKWNDWFNQDIIDPSGANLGPTRLPVIIEVGPAECPPLTVNLTGTTPVKCFGNTDGAATFEITSGVPPYTYQLDGGAETAVASNPFTLTGLAAGNHTLLVKDANGNTKSVPFFISQPAAALDAVASNVTKEGCTPGAKGSVTITATGGTSPYTVVRSGEMTSYALPKTYTGLSAGNYTFTITDANGCTDVVNVTVGKETCETTGNEGCTPGYWKNHTNSWAPSGLSPNQTAGSVFTFNGLFPTLSSQSLLATLNGSGGSGAIGGARILLRAAVAALLNAAHPSVDYTLTQASIISQVNAALATNNKDAMTKLATTLDGYNNKGCPINAHGVETSSRMLNGLETAQPIDKAFAVSGYPNPTRNNFNLQINGLLNEKVTVRVVDMTGRLVEQRTNLAANQVISIGANYGTGVYNIEVIQGDKKQQLRLLKQ